MSTMQIQMQQTSLFGLDLVLSQPNKFLGFDQRNSRLTSLVHEVAQAAIMAQMDGADPTASPGAQAAFKLEDLSVIQRRIQVLEALSCEREAGQQNVYRRLMIRILKAKARYLMRLN